MATCLGGNGNGKLNGSRILLWVLSVLSGLLVAWVWRTSDAVRDLQLELREVRTTLQWHVTPQK